MKIFILGVWTLVLTYISLVICCGSIVAVPLVDQRVFILWSRRWQKLAVTYRNSLHSSPPSLDITCRGDTETKSNYIIIIILALLYRNTVLYMSFDWENIRAPIMEVWVGDVASARGFTVCESRSSVAGAAWSTGSVLVWRELGLHRLFRLVIKNWCITCCSKY